MKKTTLLTFLLFFLTIGNVFSQSDIYTALPNNGGTSQNGRAPQGARVASRSVWLISQVEMQDANFITGNIINSLGFNYSVAQDAATTGSMVIYLQNTADIANNKATIWATAINGMTTVSNSSVTIPATAGTFDIPFTGGSAFTYTGGAVYVAFDYQNLTGTLATTPNTTLCNNSLVGGLKGALAAPGATTAPTTITVSNFRPETRFGKAVACTRPTNIAEVEAAKTTTSVTGTWSNGNATSIEYGIYGFTPGTGTTVANITSPYTVSGLLPSTVYDVYLFNNCGTTNAPVLSAATDVLSFHTVFEAASPSYNTGFEQEVFPFIGWLPVPSDTPNAWFINFGGTGSVLVQEGTSSAVAITPTDIPASERLFSRGINLVAGNQAVVTYFVRNFVTTTAPISTNTSSYQLTVGQGQDAVAQTTILATETGLSNAAFIEKTFNLTPTITGVYNFGFLHNSPANATGTHALIIDNFTVTQTLSSKAFLDEKFAVFPNPVENMLNISNDSNLLISEIKITDLNGRVIKNTTVNNLTNLNINIADFSSGIYMMNIKTNEGNITKKIIKK